MRKSTLRLLIVLALVLVMIQSYQARCQTPQKIVVDFELVFQGDSIDFGQWLQLRDWARSSLIDSFEQDGIWNYRMFVPIKAVYLDLPEHFDSAIYPTPDNILKNGYVLYEYHSGNSIIPDSLYFEEWVFSLGKKDVRKFKVKKQNNNDFIYHNLSPGFKPAKHKSDLDDKAKVEKDKKEKLKKKVK